MELKIRVGASIDRSVSVAYEPLVEAAKKAARAVSAEGARTGKGYATETKRGTDLAEKNYQRHAREVEKWQRQIARSAEKTAREGANATVKILRDETRAHAAAEREKTRATAHEASKRNRELEKSMRTAQHSARASDRRTIVAARAVSRVGSSVGTGAASLAGHVVGFGRGLASEVARGVGVDVGVESIVRKNTDLESIAAKVSNAGYMENDTRNGRRVDKNELKAQAFQVAKKTATGAHEVMSGLDAFVGKTGDLAAGRGALEHMAILAKSSGSSLEDMMDAAADVSLALGDVEGKGEKIVALMKSFTGQGKVGAVEIKNLASQMAKIGTAAGSFEGGATTIVQMGALAQMSRARGGSASATQAATSVMSFANTFSKGARQDAFANMGIDIHAKSGKFRAPKELIIEAIRASSSDSHGGMANFDRNMGKMFMDVRARSATRGFENVYKEAGGGAAGIEAVTKEFKRLEDAAISDEEVMRSFERAMETSKSKAELFNIQIQEAADKMSGPLSTAFDAWGPTIIEATNSLARFAAWVAGKTPTEELGEHATRVVEEAVAATNKQLKGGVITTPQKDRNKEADTMAGEALRAADAAEKIAKEKRDAGAEGDTTAEHLERLVGAGPVIDREREEVVALATKHREDAAKEYQKIHTLLAEQNRMISRGIIVEVKNMPKPGTIIPGRMKNPEE